MALEGSGFDYESDSKGRETVSPVEISPASDDLLKKELSKLSIIIDDIQTISKVADKFWRELAESREGKLGWAEHEKKFFEII